MPSIKRGIGLNLLFTAGVCAAWSWFNLSHPKPEGFLQFQTQTPPPGWSFQDIPLGSEVIATLATTNVINGIFSGPDGERIAVFMGNWNTDNRQDMRVLVHTPDLCWTSAGWEPVACPIGESTTILIGEQAVPFEMRVFRSPRDGQLELCVWSTLINGTPYQEMNRFPQAEAPRSNSQFRVAAAGRELTAGYFIKSIHSHAAAKKSKQFVRISIPTTHNIDLTFGKINQFASLWLNCRSFN
ncbi:MAG: exosortase-associated EpsI family protein [Planctomycetes bacterium]|nr:exosortase-associated EpsI family protein [Planctomycetota bacterium]